MAQTAVARALAVPYLDDDSPGGCPVDVAQLLRYLHANAGARALGENHLLFVRTARVNECAYWMWRFDDSNAEAFALVMLDPAGECWLSCYRNADCLSPERVLLADYRAALEDS